ncbi:EAL domain-containing protein, partial [Halorhodospira sp. 9621]|uniref:EAL domain-containing protein n=1 Tax=Halorhodospira sp. 9621 TaxID=2899135 RepID=UPI001EE88E6E
LQALPLTTLKIDRAFVSGIGSSAKSEALVRGIVSLAKGLGMPVVAEGIETDAQRAFVQRLGCERGQGFGLGRPMGADQLTELLERGARSTP